MDDREPLAHARVTRSLRALAADEEASGAADGVRVTLLEEVARIRRRRRLTAARSVLLACVLIFVVAMFQTRHIVPTADPAKYRADVGGANASPEQELVTAFFPLVFGDVPAGSGRLVRIEVPEETVARFGVQIPPTSAGRTPTVLADVLVGDDGLARAVRFVRPPAGGRIPEHQ